MIKIEISIYKTNKFRLEDPEHKGAFSFDCYINKVWRAKCSGYLFKVSCYNNTLDLLS